MKCACTANLDIANSNKIATTKKTTVKSAKNPKPERQLKPAQKDTQKDARKLIQKMGVILEVTVLTNME